MKMTLAERLRDAMKGPPKVSQVALARACGIKPPSVSDWLSGRTQRIEGMNLLNASKLLGVNPMWLAKGLGPKAASATPGGSFQDLSGSEAQLVMFFRGMNPDDQLTLLNDANVLYAKAAQLGEPAHLPEKSRVKRAA